MKNNGKSRSLLFVAFLLMFMGCREDIDDSEWSVGEDAGLDAGVDAGDVGDSDGGDEGEGEDVGEEDAGPRDPPNPQASHDECGLLLKPPSAEACPIQMADDFSGCDGEPGAVFNGSFCAEVQSCGCPGPNCPAFSTVADCAASCAEDGWCRRDRMPTYIAEWCPEFSCSGGQITSCVHGDGDPTPLLGELGVVARCREKDPYEVGVGWVGDCYVCNDTRVTWCCVLADNLVTEEVHQNLCSLSLIEEVSRTPCMVFE